MRKKLEIILQYDEIVLAVTTLASEKTGALIVMVTLILIESAVEWVRVLSGKKQARVKESPFVATRFAEEQG